MTIRGCHATAIKEPGGKVEEVNETAYVAGDDVDDAQCSLGGTKHIG